MTSKLRTAVLSAGLALAAALAFAAPAAATPVASNDAAYAALGRIFPDPLAGCQNAGSSPCSPSAQGNVPATQFIQWTEFLDAVEYMNSKPEWSRYLEVLPLDGKIGPGAGTEPGEAMFPGNDLDELEFEPKEEYVSAGLPQSDLSRKQSDLIVLRLTDESVPDEGKKRYALSLSIHGIERAGLEGGTRAAEDLVTAESTGLAGEPIVPESVDPNAPSFADVLDEAIIYLSYPNPDGWRRGSVSEGGVFFQRYNGNGVDLNRDWPDIGFSFRPYSGLSEPESQALAAFFTEVRDNAGPFAAGDDLHGQAGADALSYTLLPHGSHDYAKNERIKQTAIAIHRNSEQALSWSPIIQPNDAPQGGGVLCAPGLIGDTCAKIYGQTWGTVYDTINYTTTGALGDWFDSSVGLNADGIDNEMSFSHLDKNIVFDPHTEQLHVDGNKALMYAHLAQIVDPVESSFDAPGSKGYVPNVRLSREEKAYQPGPPANTRPQEDIEGQLGTLNAQRQVVFPFEVERSDPADGNPGIFNGGMRVEVTAQNANGIGTGTAHLAVQCRGCDEHPGVEDSGEWVTVAEDYNQSPIYAQSGVTAAVNRPQAKGPDGSPIEWRAMLSGEALGLASPTPSAVASMDVDFSSGPATTSGETGGGNPPKVAAYDVANTDFFDDLNRHIADPGERFQQVDPAGVIAGGSGLDGLDSLVLADDALPGYAGPYGPAEGPSGPPTAGFSFESSGTFPDVGVGVPGSFEDFPFEIAADEANSEAKIRIEWEPAGNDFDLYLYREEENGDLTQIDSSTSSNSEPGENGRYFEQVAYPNPGPGSYVIRVDNWLAPDSPTVSGTATFAPVSGGGGGGTGAYTVAEKDRWIDALASYVREGGNLVLTDGATKALSDLVGIAPDAISRQTVYAGQVSFSTPEDDDTTDKPLASDPVPVAQEGARFQSGMRRQTFEPTPLGFAIQDLGGSDESNARQYDIDIEAFRAAGGDVTATSANSDERDAEPVLDRVTIGEIQLGEGTIRIAGSLLPQPTQAFDHEFGLEPYAPTYTGYILARNLLEVEVADEPGPGGGKRCAAKQTGTDGDDVLTGTAGGDRLQGRGGNDRLDGRGGDDCLDGGAGEDELLGGSGDDRIDADDGEADTVSCGPGADSATVDSSDRVTGCEKVKRKKGKGRG